MTISFQLDQPSEIALQQEAAGLGVTPEQLAADIVKRHLLVRADDAPFQQAMNASLRENEELLRRFAKR
ncbi:hypothetical protein [Gemmata sp.]|uniref:hypothetical protein n=1 Tax=Gemmata sp. TaxID=1914242 RepID=UPI003F6FC1D1